MKKIAVYFSKPKAYDYPFNEAGYFAAYRELSNEIAALGAQLYVVRGDSYLGSGAFSKSWVFAEGDIVESGPVVADVVYEKGARQTIFRDGSVPVLNCPQINGKHIRSLKSIHHVHGMPALQTN